MTTPAAFRNKLVSGTSYRFISRARDQADNVEFGPLNGDVPGTVGVTVLVTRIAQRQLDRELAT